MRFRIGLLVGLAVGYYHGAKAGRERYHQIEDVLDRVRDTALYRDVQARLEAVVPDPVQRARALLGADDDPTAPIGDPTFN